MNTTETTTPRSLRDAIRGLTEAVKEAKDREIKMNRRLGYADDHQKGSLVVTVRWDVAETLLKSSTTGRENQ